MSDKDLRAELERAIAEWELAVADAKAMAEALKGEITRRLSDCTAEWCHGKINGDCRCIEKMKQALTPERRERYLK